MRLHGLSEGAFVGTQYRTVFRESSTGSGQLSQVGTLPVPASGRAGASYRLKTSSRWKGPLSALVGRFPSVNVWALSADDLLATADSYVFVSRDGGETWTVSWTLPASSSPMGVLPTGLCVHDGAVYLGEYPLSTSDTPRIIRSTDRGETWSVVATLPDVRHVHSIQADPYTGELWVTTGDSGTACQIGRLRHGGIEIVGSGSQEWRAVELAFTPESIVWGVDSVYLESNPIFRLDRSRVDAGTPSPERLSDVSSSVYYATTFTVDSTLWIAVSTAMEAGADSTGPDSQTPHSDGASVLAASSTTDFTVWHELASYEKRSVPADRWRRAPTANAYVFLASDPDRGLITNPYNTARDDGTIVSYPPAFFTRLDAHAAVTNARPVQSAQPDELTIE